MDRDIRTPDTPTAGAEHNGPRQRSASPDCPAEALGPIDRAWLEMDDPRNPMVVAAILELDGAVDLAALKNLLANRLLRYHRFRQCADASQDPPLWVPDPALNVEYHVRTKQLPPGAADGDLRRAIAEELGKPLDRALPLWRMILFRHGHDRTTVLFRGHHAMGDGMAFLHVLMSCTDDGQRMPIDQATTESHVHHGPLGGVIDRLESVNTLLENLYDVAIDDLRHPSHLLEQLRDGRRALSAIRRVLALPDDNPPALHNELSGKRAVGWTSGLPFEPIRRLAKTQRVKVNDVFVSALAGALGRYLRESGGQQESENFRVSIPVNLRSENDRRMGNYFGLVLLDLPVGIVDWSERLRVVSERMNALKDSPEARAVLIALAAAGYMPAALEKRLVRLVGSKAAAVVSNLPGPKQPLHIGGARLANMVFWPPQAGGIGVGISLFSYAGDVTVGVTADTAQIEHPQRVVELFELELREMSKA